MNLEDLRGNGPDQVDNSNVGDGADDGGFDPNDYEGVDSPSSTTASLLPLHMSRQPVLCTTMNSRSSGATPVTKQGISCGTAPVCLKALKDKKGLNLKGVPNMGGQKPPKQPDRAVESTPPTK